TAVAGRKAGKEGVQMMAIDNIPFEIQGIGSVIVVFLTAMGVSISLDRLLSGTLDMWTSQMQFYNYTIRILTIGGGLILLAVCLSIVRHLKNKSFWRNTLLGKVWYVCKENMLEAKTLPLGISLGFIGFVGVNGILVFMILMGSGFLFILATLAAFVFNGMTLIALFKIANDFRVLAQGAKRIEAGDLEYKISLSHTMPAMKEMTRTINNIGDGLSNSVDKALRSEKMKTELITNVSHDLKTPLTSIISYIDLLKAENIESEAAREYIEIISERGERLKILIQDLVEASKAATGNIAVNLETLELGQFVQQAVGEYTDRLEMNGLNIVMQCEEEVYVAADGRHMWRVVENLLSNVAKYAMSHTRVYMDVTREDEWGIVTIKNISREQLAGKESFLTERFVRGDEARSTEGSGLGLAIANSLIGMQKGRLAIEVDGDLFKVKVALPIAVEEKNSAEETNNPNEL
ncbi:MAG: sensor histidine kinase, partial [Cellulosilyticaceae bacterium]